MTNNDGTLIDDLAGFNIYKSTDINTVSKSVVYQYVSPTTLIIIETVPSVQVYYYIVKSVDMSGNESNSSVIANTSLQGETIIMSFDNNFKISLPKNENNRLQSSNNDYYDDLRFEISSDTQSVSGQVIAIYELVITKASNSQVIPDYRFKEPVEIKFTVPSGAAGTSISGFTKLADATQTAIYWYNGVEYIKLGSKTQNQVVSVKTINLGTYQVRTVSRASSFEFSRVVPKIFTPNNDGENDYTHVYYDNPKDSAVTGKIYDLTGHYVANMESGDFTNSIKWNGKDTENNFVPKGVYLYQLEVEGEGKVINGTVVVAR
jgi:gliding motility-associated-like protein